jgi:transposase
MERHTLTDREWGRLAPLLPTRPRTGRPPKDHRLIIDALLWLDRTGAPWRDLPERFRPWRTVATRFSTAGPGRGCGSVSSPSCAGSRTRKAGSTGRCTSSMARACGCTAVPPEEKGRLRQALGRSRGGFGSKLHVRGIQRTLTDHSANRCRNSRVSRPVFHRLDALEDIKNLRFLIVK